MQPALLILPIVVPIVLWSAYHYHKDRHMPEPALNLLLCFCLGLMSAGLSRLMYVGLEPLGLRYDAVALGVENPLGLLVFAVLVIGPIEEIAKLLPFVVIVIRLKAFDEPMDGIIYASFIGLGYASVENLQYLDFLTPLEALARGFAGPVVHILFASIAAHWVTGAVLSGRSYLKPMTLGLLCAATLHGIYDFLVLLEPVSALPIAAGLVVGLWIWRLLLLRRLHREAVRATRAAAQPKPPRH